MLNNQYQHTRKNWMRRKCKIRGTLVHCYYLEHHLLLVYLCPKRRMGCLRLTRISGLSPIPLLPTLVRPQGQSYNWTLQSRRSKSWHRRLFLVHGSHGHLALSLKWDHPLALLLEWDHLLILLLLRWARLLVLALPKWIHLLDQSPSRSIRLLIRPPLRQISCQWTILNHQEDLRYVCLGKSRYQKIYLSPTPARPGSRRSVYPPR
jgi:hypothetical protein